MKTIEIRNVKKDKIRPKQTRFPILSALLDPYILDPQRKNNKTVIPLKCPSMAFIFLF